MDAGEMVAIMGPSGSGKSTLMNILGCLDRPTSGSHRIAGRETSSLDPDELARLRREHFGFIFQRYHLLPELTAIGNIEIPAIYAGQTPSERQRRAAGLLRALALSDRAAHRPSQLSGGQQQRVSIARALMNDAQIVLADEPTGALDSRSGEDVLRILQDLNGEGRTVIIVTHDMDVARRADRIVEISDGAIVADRKVQRDTVATTERPRIVVTEMGFTLYRRPWRIALDRFREAFRMALLAMRAHRLRAFLTMLGIIIGIAAVVCVVALGRGSQQRVLADISRLGTDTLEVFPGKDFGDVRSGKITTLVVADANELARQPDVAAVTPTVSTGRTVRFGSKEASAQVNGVGERYFEIKSTKLTAGQFFDADSVQSRAQDVVIDENVRETLFGDLPGGPIGRVIFIGRVPCRIIGIIEAQQGGFGSSQNLSVYLPYTTVQARMLGTSSLRSINVRVSGQTTPALAEGAVTQLLIRRHGTRDFFILNSDDIRKTITSTTQTMTALVAAIAFISLLVGGIGVMNIMLVSVSERVSEIGVRMAVGARRSDILQQFLIEAVLVCLMGGVLGVAAALGFGVIYRALGMGFSLDYS